MKLSNSHLKESIKLLKSVIIMYFIQNFIINFTSIFMFQTIGNVADSILTGDEIFKEDIVIFIMSIVFMILVLPIINYLSNIEMLKCFIKHDKFVVKQFMQKKISSVKKYDSGELLYKLENDPMEFRYIILDIVVKLFQVIDFGSILTFQILKINIIYGIIVIILSSVVVVVSYLTKNIKSKYREQAREYGQWALNHEVNMIDAYKYIKVNGVLYSFIKNYNSRFKSAMEQYVKRSKILDNIIEAVNQIKSYSSQIVIVVLGLLFYQKGAITIGAITIMLGYFTLMKDVFEQIGGIITQREYLKLYTGYVEQLCDEQEGQKKGKDNIINVIEMKNLSYSYADKSVIEKLNFTIRKGDKILIKGPNGSGKSTFIKILLGFLDDYSGNVLINGDEKKDIDMYCNILYLEQNPYIFDGTLKENINLGDDEIEEKYIEKLYTHLNLEHINLNEYSEEQDNLSGGEKQKIALARVMVRDRQIIVLDEPFNHIDTEGKEAVRKFIIECEKRNKTIILITHHMIDLNNEWRILEFK